MEEACRIGGGTIGEVSEGWLDHSGDHFHRMQRENTACANVLNSIYHRTYKGLKSQHLGGNGYKEDVRQYPNWTDTK